MAASQSSVRPKVFISYSHESDGHNEKVRRLHSSLTEDGCDGIIDVMKTTDEGWPTWMTRQVEDADFILCIVTETYTRRFNDKEEPEKGRGSAWEAGLIQSLLYDKKLHNSKILPVCFTESDLAHIPLVLKSYERFLLAEEEDYENLLRKVFGAPKHAPPTKGEAPILTSTKTARLFGRPGGDVSAVGSRMIFADIDQISDHVPADLIGRDDDLRMLDDIWEQVQSGDSGRPRVLSIAALGGEGKTSLIAKWTAGMARQDWPSCDGVFAWSFYKQGRQEQAAPPVELFLKAALSIFGNEEDREVAASAADEMEKSQRLVTALRKKRALLILDGLEPLQYAPASPTAGKIKNRALATLLRGLATSNSGLCIVTTRYPVADLKAFLGSTVREEKLKPLSRDNGVKLLKVLGVSGTEHRHIPVNDADPDSELVNSFEKLVEDVKGHALTLTLIGTFLARAFRGDIRERSRVKFEKADEKVDGGHAFRTIAAYEEWLLSDGGEEGKRQVAVLRAMGLFDRPASADCLEALRSKSIPELSEPLAPLTNEDWEFCLSGLQDAKLVTITRDEAGALVSLDTHPHLREYFAQQLRRDHPKAWRAAHRLLYDYLRSIPDKPQPSLEELQPLLQAVSHACQAGAANDAFWGVYYNRIHQRKYYLTKILGAFGSDLSTLTGFYENPWAKPDAGLDEAARCLLFRQTSFCLRSLGLYREAEPVAGLALESSLKKPDAYGGEIISASQMSELKLLLGKIGEAIGFAESAVQLCRGGTTYERKVATRCTLAHALHQAGRDDEALTAYKEAEEIEAAALPESPLLRSYQGFVYHEFLQQKLERDAWRAWLSKADSRVDIDSIAQLGLRAGQCLKYSTEKYVSILSVELSRLTLARLELYRDLLGPRKSHESEGKTNRSEANLTSVVGGLLKAGQMQFVVGALLTRAWSRARAGAFTGNESAEDDLNEAWAIAKDGPMRLLETDIYLYRARLFGGRNHGSRYPWESSQKDIQAAEERIRKNGYHRRKPEIGDAKVALGI